LLKLSNLNLGQKGTDGLGVQKNFSNRHKYWNNNQNYTCMKNEKFNWWMIICCRRKTSFFFNLGRFESGHTIQLCGPFLQAQTI
jgi:hypothetical protein